jgi:pimeloyl-ACP methyl ester carboxylesterase
MKISDLLPRRRAPRNALILTALAAAASAIGAALLARMAEREDPPAGEFVTVDGVALHYLERGKGPVVVLIHGNAVRLQDFIAGGLIDRLSATHRVIAFDRPGFGYSDRPRDRAWTPAAQAEVLHRALKQLHADRPVVLGHSFGTQVALEMALNHPGDVNGLVLVGGYYYPTARLDVAMMAPAALPIVGDVLRYTVMPWSARAMLPLSVRAMFAPKPLPDDFMSTVGREMMVRPKQLRANAEDAAAMIPAARLLEQRYHDLAMAVSLIAGDGDLVVDPKAHTERLHRELPESTLTIVPGAGHMVHHAIPDGIENEVNRVSLVQIG